MPPNALALLEEVLPLCREWEEEEEEAATVDAWMERARECFDAASDATGRRHADWIASLPAPES